ncbi:MAG: hypothetical protein H0U07_09670 [Actinobacteria bacterium]|nr:hypothetical protein [Actinomycetota bacterium]
MLDPDEFELREHQYQALEALGYLLSLPAVPGAAPAAGGQAGTADKLTVASRAELAAPLLRVLRWDRPAPVPRP